MQKSVYDPDAFEQRVKYAAQCIMVGRTHTRHFDTCFEMNDGDYVVSALIRRAENNPALMDRIKSVANIAMWNESHQKLAHIPRRKLAQAAKDHVRELDRPRREFWQQNQSRYIAVAAWGDWHPHVPSGMVGVKAHLGSKLAVESFDEPKWFLVPNAEYVTGRYGFVIDEAIHKQCDPIE